MLQGCEVHAILGNGDAFIAGQTQGVVLYPPMEYDKMMKKLTEYTRHGITRNVIQRQGMIAIAQGKHDFEVITVQSHNGREIAGNHVPAAEFPPSSEQWGAKGWTYRDSESAQIKFNELTQ